MPRKTEIYLVSTERKEELGHSFTCPKLCQSPSVYCCMWAIAGTAWLRKQGHKSQWQQPERLPECRLTIGYVMWTLDGEHSCSLLSLYEQIWDKIMFQPQNMSGWQCWVEQLWSNELVLWPKVSLLHCYLHEKGIKSEEKVNKSGLESGSITLDGYIDKVNKYAKLWQN